MAKAQNQQAKLTLPATASIFSINNMYKQYVLPCRNEVSICTLSADRGLAVLTERNIVRQKSATAVSDQLERGHAHMHNQELTL